MSALGKAALLDFFLRKFFANILLAGSWRLTAPAPAGGDCDLRIDFTPPAYRAVA